MKLGDRAPDFSLPGVDGKTYTLASFKDKKALAVLFSCNHCPYVQAAEEKLVSFQRKYGVLAAINPNDDSSHPEDSFEKMVERAAEKGFNFPYLRDASQAAARAYGATHTPQLFIFDAARKLAYTGSVEAASAAVEDILAGRPVREPETRAIGCTIKWKR